MKKSQVAKNWPKYLVQWLVLALILFFVTGAAVALFSDIEPADVERYCPMGGLEAFATYLVKGSLPCSMTSMQIVMGLVLAAVVILFSKLFCGYICPVGAFEDILIRVRKALKIKDCEIRGGSVADKILRIVKYALLYWIVYMTVNASELFCKNLDPYYAVATGFKGEITLWMSLVTVGVVLLLGFFVKRFWCKYICPLGAISNSLKFWVWMVAGVALFWVLALCGVSLPWHCMFGLFLLAAYLLEIFCGRPKAQILHVIVDQSRCGRSCYSCMKQCPYNINVPDEGNVVRNVDCVLCGECVAACPGKALSIGVCSKGASACGGKHGASTGSGGESGASAVLGGEPGASARKGCSCGGWKRSLPAVIAVVAVVVAYIAGGKFELPTISESWDVEEGMELETVVIKNLRSVKCYGSSMAFKARMMGVRGVHGVKTYVGSHTVELLFDPAKTSAEKLQEEVFVPSHFRVWSPDPAKLSELKIITIRTEKMYDKLDLNYLGLQFRTTGKGIFGVESEYDCPLIVKVYVSPAEADSLNEDFFREIVERKVLAMPVHGGGVKETPVDFEFVRMEKEVGTIGISDYLHRMFDPFQAEYSGKFPASDAKAVAVAQRMLEERAAEDPSVDVSAGVQPDSTGMIVAKRAYYFEGEPQFIYEIKDQSYEKPILKRALPYLSNHLSTHDGVIGTYLALNRELVPSIQIRFAAPMTAEKIWELINLPEWTITYAPDDVRVEGARLTFDEPGVCYPYE